MVLPYPSVGVVTETDLSTSPEVMPELPGQDFMVSKDIEWSTGRRMAGNGRTIRNANFSSPTYHFSIRHNVLRDRPALPELAKLIGFFNSRHGGYGTFFYKDPSAYQVTDEPFGTGDGTTTVFQAQRTVGRGTTYPSIEPVYAFWETPVVKVSGGAVSVTIDPWGVITFLTPPANAAALTWTGKFLHVCAFDDDTLSVSQIVSDLWSQEGFKFTSQRP